MGDTFIAWDSCCSSDDDAGSLADFVVEDDFIGDSPRGSEESSASSPVSQPEAASSQFVETVNAEQVASVVNPELVLEPSCAIVPSGDEEDPPTDVGTNRRQSRRSTSREWIREDIEMVRKCGRCLQNTLDSIATLLETLEDRVSELERDSGTTVDSLSKVGDRRRKFSLNMMSEIDEGLGDSKGSSDSDSDVPVARRPRKRFRIE
jgi:hypothetical protein